MKNKYVKIAISALVAFLMTTFIVTIFFTIILNAMEMAGLAYSVASIVSIILQMIVSSVAMIISNAIFLKKKGNAPIIAIAGAVVKSLILGFLPLPTIVAAIINIGAFFGIMFLMDKFGADAEEKTPAGVPQNGVNPNFPQNGMNPNFRPQNGVNPNFPQNGANPNFPQNGMNPNFRPQNGVNPNFPQNTANPNFAAPAASAPESTQPQAPVNPNFAAPAASAPEATQPQAPVNPNFAAPAASAPEATQPQASVNPNFAAPAASAPKATQPQTPVNPNFAAPANQFGGQPATVGNNGFVDIDWRMYAPLHAGVSYNAGKDYKFHRAEGFVGSVPQNFINRTFPKCPVCCSATPYWTISQHNQMSMKGNLYLFKCSQCGGIISMSMPDVTTLSNGGSGVLSNPTVGLTNLLVKSRGGKEAGAVYAVIESVGTSGASRECEGLEFKLEHLQQISYRM